VRTVQEILDETSKETHDYDFVYAMIPRDGVRKVLEVGCSEKSLKAYSELYPFAEIYGVDIEAVIKEDFLKENPRIYFQQTDAYAQPAQLPPLDLIVDDAVHEWEQQVRLYNRLYDFLNPGGWYVIEDIFTPAEIQRKIPTAYIVRTGRSQDSVIALFQKGW
jgi:trans-aconitate methyltransferase